jgi:hypothetical protein
MSLAPRRTAICGTIPEAEEIAMPYIVQAEEADDHSAVSKRHTDRKEALANAVRWTSEGRKVKIIGNGRIYTTTELALSIINDEG